MHEYEIRIFHDDGRTAIVLAGTQLNDNAAVRYAKKAAGARKFEVWRGLDCVYGTGLAPIRQTHSPNYPAA
ncbi:MAG TPA: hypothetical protein VGH23_01555 [Rhizomicrobium sp.]